LISLFEQKQYCSIFCNRTNLSIGPLFEAMMLLSLAEMKRVNDEEDSARELISLAVEYFPGHLALREFEASLGDMKLPEINPRELLLAP
jgi:hypothetical protein